MNLTSDYPYWLVKNGIKETYPALDSDTACDILVIGGGITGAMAAYELVENGYDVILCDGHHAGTGSTGGSTALIQYETDAGMLDLTSLYGESKAKKYFKLSFNAVADIKEMVKHLHLDCDFRSRHSIYLASTKDDAVKLKEEFVLRKKAGYEIQYFDKAEIESKFSFSAAGGIWSDGSCEMDPFKFILQLLQLSQKKGARIHNNTFIKELKNGRKKATAITSSGCNIKSNYIIIACGYESEYFIEKKYSRLKSTYAIISEPLKDIKDPWYRSCLIWETARPYLYLRTTKDKRIMIGGLDEDFYNPRKRDSLLKQKASRLKSMFLERFPHIDFKTDFAWTGTFAESKDSLPYIGRLTPNSRIIYAIGFGGNGITFGRMAATLIPKLIKRPGNSTATLFNFKR